MNGTLARTVKSIGVTELRQRTAEILDQVRESTEPLAILQRSQTAAYLVESGLYEAQMKELRAARRALFLLEVKEAEAELAAGGGKAYPNMEALLDDLRR